MIISVQTMEFQHPQICLRANVDCREYLRTGKCKYGNQCKFNHPPVNCRDYLRTGNCKYGNQCKYNHPPWVQSGGGIKERINPCKPLFPIRPNEPPCPYFLRYGTCKFGQTCKFHHPPSALSASENNCFLAQRPTEPDCIFFLKHGHCKFGSTCKFHHPLSILGIINDMAGTTAAATTQSVHHMNNRNNDQFAYTMGVNNFSTIPFQITDNSNSTVLLPVQTVYQEKESVHYVVHNAPVPAQVNSTNMIGTTPVLQRNVPPPSYSNTMSKNDEVQLHMAYSTNNGNHNFAFSSQESKISNDGYYMSNGHSAKLSPQKIPKQDDSWSRVQSLPSFQNELQGKYSKKPNFSNDWNLYSGAEAEMQDESNSDRSYPIKLQNSPYVRNERSNSLGSDTSQFKTLNSSPVSTLFKPIFSDDYGANSPKQYSSNEMSSKYQSLHEYNTNSPKQYNLNGVLKSNDTSEYQALDNDEDEALSKMTSTILNLIDTPTGSTDNDNPLVASSSASFYDNSSIDIYQHSSDYSYQHQSYSNRYNSHQSLSTQTSKILEQQSHPIIRE